MGAVLDVDNKEEWKHVQRVMLLTCVREVPGSNLGGGIDYTD
jgi:hypothetical protein